MDICVLIRKVGTVSSLSTVPRNFDAIDMITDCREFRLNRNVGEEGGEGRTSRRNIDPNVYVNEAGH